MPIKKLSKHCFRSVSMVLSPAKGHCRKETMYTCKHSASPLIIKRYRDMKHLYHADRFPEQGIIKPVLCITCNKASLQCKTGRQIVHNTRLLCNLSKMVKPEFFGTSEV